MAWLVVSSSQTHIQTKCTKRTLRTTSVWAVETLQEGGEFEVVCGVRAEEGQGMVEYGLIIFFVAFVVIAVMILVGPRIANVFSTLTAAI